MDKILTILIAMAPISELRLAIPFALTHYLSISEAYFYSVLGNILPVFLILLLLEPVSIFLIKRFEIAKKFFQWLFERARLNNHQKFERWGKLALVILVAIPLPMTGAWSGAVVSFVFGIPYWKSIGLIFTGILIAGVIVTLATTGVVSIFKIIL